MGRYLVDQWLILRFCVLLKRLLGVVAVGWCWWNATEADLFLYKHERARQSASSSVTRETQEGETEKENSDVIEGQRDCVVSTIYHRD